jgi:hypothetical protein
LFVAHALACAQSAGFQNRQSTRRSRRLKDFPARSTGGRFRQKSPKTLPAIETIDNLEERQAMPLQDVVANSVLGKICLRGCLKFHFAGCFEQKPPKRPSFVLTEPVVPV